VHFVANVNSAVVAHAMLGTHDSTAEATGAWAAGNGNFDAIGAAGANPRNCRNVRLFMQFPLEISADRRQHREGCLEDIAGASCLEQPFFHGGSAPTRPNIRQPSQKSGGIYGLGEPLR
jgi:hypothetical protein